MLSHVEICGLGKLEKMVICCYCKKSVSKVYLNCHLRTCNALFEINLKERMDAINSLKIGKEVVLGNTGRIKRASMIKAEEGFKTVEEDFDPDFLIRFPVPPRKGVHNKWKKELRNRGPAKCYFKNCDFQSKNVNLMKTHVNGCTAISSLPLSCLKCNFSNGDINMVRQHIIENHRDQLVNNDDSDATIASDDDDDDVMSSGIDEPESHLEDESISEEKAKPKGKKTPSKDKSNTSIVPTPSKAAQRAPENKYRKCRFFIISNFMIEEYNMSVCMSCTG